MSPLPPLPNPGGPAAQPYQARHLIGFPADVVVDEVETLALSRFAGARWDVAPEGAEPLVPPARNAGPVEPGVLRTSRHSTLTGPYAAAGGGMPPGTEFVFDVVCPRERGDAPYPGGGDRDGIGRAFPAGLPVREEERVVAFLVAAARRLGGSVRTDVGNPAGPGVVLTPDAAVAIDMTLYSDVWLDPNAALALVARQHPRTRLATEGRSYQGPPQGITELPLYPGEKMDPELRRRLHAAADDVDIKALTTGAVLDGYGLLVDLGMDGLVAVEVGGEEQLPLLLRGLPWTTQGAVSYRVHWEPQDLVESQREQPSLDHQIARKRAAETVTQITKTLYDAVGGEIADEAEFLVDPVDL